MRLVNEVMADLVASGLTPAQLVLMAELSAAAAYASNPVETREQRKKRISRETSARHRASQNVTNASPEVSNDVTQTCHPTSQNVTDASPLARVVNIKPTTIITGQEEKVVGKGSRLPETWTPSDVEIKYALDKGLTPEETERAATDFRDYWCSKSGSGAVMRNWTATWQRWVRTAVDRKQERQARMASRPPPRGNGSDAASFVDVIARRRFGAGQ